MPIEIAEPLPSEEWPCPLPLRLVNLSWSAGEGLNVIDKVGQSIGQLNIAARPVSEVADSQTQNVLRQLANCSVAVAFY